MPLDRTDDKWILVQVMALCRQATRHFQCWNRFMSPHGGTGPQCVNFHKAFAIKCDKICPNYRCYHARKYTWYFFHNRCDIFVLGLMSSYVNSWITTSRVIPDMSTSYMLPCNLLHSGFSSWFVLICISRNMLHFTLSCTHNIILSL